MQNQRVRYDTKFAIGATCAKLKKTFPGVAAPIRATRGTVSGFSWRSRKRLLDWLHSINQRQTTRGLFVTLTYHLNYGDDWRVWKRHLDIFFKRCKRKYPKFAAVWKLEFQERGAPHFHLLVFNVYRMEHDWVASAWNDIVDPGNPEHLAAGTEVRRIRSFGGVIHYALKYIAKVGGLPEGTQTGRIWGVVGRVNLDVLFFCMELGRPAYDKLHRVLRKWVQRKLRRRWRAPPNGGITAYISSDTMWELLLWAEDAARGIEVSRAPATRPVKDAGTPAGRSPLSLTGRVGVLE